MNQENKTIEQASDEYGLAVARHQYERSTMTNIDGSPREFRNRPDFLTKHAFIAGANWCKAEMQQEIDNQKAQYMEVIDELVHYFKLLKDASFDWCQTTEEENNHDVEWQALSCIITDCKITLASIEEKLKQINQSNT